MSFPGRDIVGQVLPESTMRIDAGRLRSFARAIGETDPVYYDESAALAAGYQNIPAPPTYCFSVLLEMTDPTDWVAQLQIDPGRMLHGTQSFTYHRVPQVGDVLSVRSTISNYFERKNGSLKFIEQRCEVSDHDDREVAQMTCLLIITAPEEAEAS